MTRTLAGVEAMWVVIGALRSIPEEVPLGWVAAVLGFLGHVEYDESNDLIEEILQKTYEYCPELRSEAEKLLLAHTTEVPTTTTTTTTSSSSPDCLLQLADTFLYKECICSRILDSTTTMTQNHANETEDSSTITTTTTNTKLAPFIREHVLPMLLASGKITGEIPATHS